MTTDPSLPTSTNLDRQEMEAPSPLIRLLPHAINSLPTHPALASTISAQNNGEAVQDPDRLLNYAQTLLAEAIAFTDSYLPGHFKSKSSLKSSPPATAKVELLEYIRNQKGNEETWFARRSRHANVPEPGSATFAEMDAGLRHEHSLHEMQYTPDVFDAHEVLSWDGELANVLPSSTSSSTSSPFTEISMRIYEMCHSLPAPLQPRVFSVLVASAKTSTTTSSSSQQSDGFIIVQIPIDIKSVPAAFYSNGRNIKEGTSPEKRKSPVIGIYTSIERCRFVPPPPPPPGGSGGEKKMEEDGETEWIMATASDARGILPMWMQKMGTPGVVVKDVGLFVKWVQGRR